MKVTASTAHTKQGMIKIFHKFDWTLFISIILLLVLSLAVLYPISQSESKIELRESHFFKQAVFIVFGLVVFFVFSFLDYRNLKSYSTILFLIGLALLVAVIFFGKVIRGTAGWIGFGDMHVQPVEPFKIISAIALARFFSLHSRASGDFRKILISLVPIAISFFLILRQPDLGSAIVIVFLWLGVLLMSGVRKKYLWIILIIGIIMFMVSWLYLLENYQKERVTTLFDPFSDPLGSGYNVIQATVAVGSGGIWGKGLGHGSQSQLNFLPEKHTDFIFAVISEELGFGGAIFVMLLLLLVILRFIKIVRNSKDSFGKLLVGGLASLIFVQSLINIGMNIGLVPVTGIPLPFLSYGGSSLLTMMLGAGIAESVHRISKY